jgi:selenocysteine-specific elongation factor
MGNWARYFHTNERQVKAWIKEINIRNEKGLLFTEETLNNSIELFRKILIRFHKENPYKKSLSKDRIKEESQFSENWAIFLLSYLEKELINLEGGYALHSHSVVLSDADELLATKLDLSVKATAYKLFKANELSEESPKKVLEILHILKDDGKVFEVAQGMWIHASVLNKLTHDLSQYFSSRPILKVADFKEMTSTSRKTAIPLLEYCDKLGLTQRNGDFRNAGEHFA